MSGKSIKNFKGPKKESFEAAERHVEAFLRRKKLKLTNQRLDILKQAAYIGSHFTVDDLVESFRRRKQKPSKATVYRCLSLFTECGVLEEHDFKFFPSSIYEFVWGRDHHDHLICLSCGKIIEFFNAEIEKLQDKIADEKNFHPEFHSQKIYGICEECWKKGVRSIS